MEEINLVDLFRYYVKKIYIIILMVILFGLVGYYYINNIKVPMFHGSTTIILVQKSSGSSYETQNELSINEKLVSTYSELIKSRRILNQVISNLKLKMETDELVNLISVSSASETSIIKVTVSNENNKLACDIANNIAEVFKKEVTKIYDLENITIIDKAIVEDEPYNINFIKQMLIFTVSGLVLSCGIIFLMFYFDSSVKNKKDVESRLGLPVLGEIPVAKRLINNVSNKKSIPVSIMVNEDDFNNIDKVNSKSNKNSKDNKDNESNVDIKKKSTKKRSTSKKGTKKKTNTSTDNVKEGE
jgi:capsular polysaccharide biosynthesis protein